MWHDAKGKKSVLYSAEALKKAFLVIMMLYRRSVENWTDLRGRDGIYSAREPIQPHLTTSSPSMLGGTKVATIFKE
jgi:hypothetical protein